MAAFATCLTIPLQEGFQHWWGLEGEAVQQAEGQLWDQGATEFSCNCFLKIKPVKIL